MDTHEVASDRTIDAAAGFVPTTVPAGRFRRNTFRTSVGAGFAAAAILLAAPVAYAAAPAPAAPYSAIARIMTVSTLPHSVTPTTRRTGSVPG